jgi:superfamily II DNA/RNA helicase
VGRTARAGKPGTAITLLEHRHVFFFKKMIEQIQSSQGESKHKIREIKIPRAQLRPLQPEYRESLVKLREELAKAAHAIAATTSSSKVSKNSSRNGGRAMEKKAEKEGKKAGVVDMETTTTTTTNEMAARTAHNDENEEEAGDEDDGSSNQNNRRKKKFITNTKFLKRLKQIKKMNE